MARVAPVGSTGDGSSNRRPRGCRARRRALLLRGPLRDRLRLAAREVGEASWFHAVVVNDDADRAAEEVAAIIEASRTF